MNVVKCHTDICEVLNDLKLPFDQYIADGVRLEFNFTFLLLIPKYLAVYLSLPDAVPSPCDKLTLDTDYQITAYGDDKGGTIKMAKVYPKGSVVTITLESDFMVATNFKEGKTFSGAELDLAFKQTALYLRELYLLYDRAIKFPINAQIKNNISTYAPLLKEDHVWVGKNNQIIQVPLPDGGGGKPDCCDVLKEQLAESSYGVDGAKMIGLFNEVRNIQTNVSTAINNLYEKIDSIVALPTPKADEVGLPISYKDGAVFWDKSSIGSIIAQSTDDRPFGYLYADGTGYYPFETSEEGIPYSRLADKWWDEENGRYEFGGDGKTYYAQAFPNSNQLFVMINDIRIVPKLYFENVDVSIFKNYEQTSLSCAQLVNLNEIEIFERAPSTGGFSDNGTGVTFSFYAYSENTPGNSGVINFNQATIHYKGGEYFTIFGIRVYYIVAGQGKVPSSTGIRRMVRVDLPVEHNLYEVEFLTRHALIGTGLFVVNIDFRENAVFSLNNLNVYLKNGTDDPIYTRESMTIFVPEDMPQEDKYVYIQKAINKYSFAVPDIRDLYLRGGDSDQLDIDIAWRNIDTRKKFRLQYGGNCMSDIVKRHFHEYSLASSTYQPGGMVLANADSGSDVRLYVLPRQKTGTYGGKENRVASLSVYYYVKY